LGIKPTRVWVYAQVGTNITSPMIEVETGTPVTVKWINVLPQRHLLRDYIDDTIHGTGFPAPEVKTVVHMHGGIQPSTDDGQPNDWITPGEFKIYNYPIIDGPCMHFWHDHAIGITRLNVYAGLNGAPFIIRNSKLEHDKLNLPRGKYEIPLVITDKTFDTNGQLVFATCPHVCR
jgi:spore coat protein A, manganese oxidase